MYKTYIFTVLMSAIETRKSNGNSTKKEEKSWELKMNTGKEEK